MVIWHLVLIIILGLIPILVGARFRALRKKDEKNFGIGSAIQIGAICGTCIMIIADFTGVYYAFYIALGLVLIIYIITYAYIYSHFMKK